MTLERVSGILTKWDLDLGDVPPEGVWFRVLREEYDASGPEPVRTIKAITIGHSEDTRRGESL